MNVRTAKRAAMLVTGGVVFVACILGAYSAGNRTAQQTIVSTFNDGWSTSKSDDTAQCVSAAARYGFTAQACHFN